ncbi:MAG: hypothetical protein ABI443_08025 [Chthoniobacterales bacterium]
MTIVTMGIRSIKSRRKAPPLLIVSVFFSVLFLQQLAAQVNVELTFKRNLYLKYEPVIATVTIENQTGRELHLTDSGGKPWFGFEIEAMDGRLIPPRDPNYKLTPVQLGPGQSLTRQINITPLYLLGEDGSYWVHANVYVDELNLYFRSPRKRLDITEGTLLWQQELGVPDSQEGAGGKRTISLISLRWSHSTQLYLRVEDKVNGIIYGTLLLGRFVSFGAPKIKFDVHNNIYVMQNAAPRVFMFTKVNLQGKIIEQKVYDETLTRPALHTKGGEIVVLGGQVRDTAPGAKTGATPESPSLSERPAPLPKD